MLTKQEQEILDNAPKGVSHYMIMNKAGSVMCDLVDLRKKGKTVWDAVNKCYSQDGIVLGVGWYINQIGAISFNGAQVCTIEEFNQHVKEMSEFAGVDKYIDYISYGNELLSKENSDYSYYEGDKVSEEKPVYFNASLNVCTKEGAKWVLPPKGAYTVKEEKRPEPMIYGPSPKAKPDFAMQEEKPVYTQAMEDAGELPSVGMECEMFFDIAAERWVKVKVEAVIGGFMWLSVVESLPSDMPTFTYAEAMLAKHGKYVFTVEANKVFRPIDTRTPKQKQVDEISKHLTMQGFAHDPIWIKSLQSHGYLVSVK